jgi:hypothetical protein
LTVRLYPFAESCSRITDSETGNGKNKGFGWVEGWGREAGLSATAAKNAAFGRDDKLFDERVRLGQSKGLDKAEALGRTRNLAEQNQTGISCSR